MTHHADNEAVRAGVAARYRRAEMPDDRVFEDAARLAGSIAGTQVAALTLIDAHHVWIVAGVGMDAVKLQKAGSFCERTVALGRRLVIEDAREDAEFAGADFVVGEPRLRYYAGLPMVARDGHVIGTLCIADRRPCLAITEEQFRHLALVLEITVDRLEQRRAMFEREAALAAAYDLSQTLGSEAASLVLEAERLDAASRRHETAADLAMRNVREVVLLDREIHDSIIGAPRRGGRAARLDPLPEAIGSQLTLHNAISMAAEDEIDALVGSAAVLRLRSGKLQGQGQRLVDLSAVLDDLVGRSSGRPGALDAAKGMG